MSISVTCNNCGSNINAPDNAAGKKAKCPRCQGELQIPSTQIAVAPKTIARPVQPAPKQDMVPATIPATELKHYKECPFCSEEIAHTAKICKHCGETLDPTLRAAEEAKRSRRERDSDRGRDSGTKVVVNTVVNNSYDRGFNHTVHLVLDVLTCGAWIPVHLLCWILYECGGMLAWGLAAGVVALFGLIGFFVFAAFIGAINKPPQVATQPSGRIDTKTTDKQQPIKNDIVNKGAQVDDPNPPMEEKQIRKPVEPEKPSAEDIKRESEETIRRMARIAEEQKLKEEAAKMRKEAEKKMVDEAMRTLFVEKTSGFRLQNQLSH